MKRKHILPPQLLEGNLFSDLKKRADDRRAALRAAGLTTYETGFRGDAPAIICLCCGLGSSNPTDIQERYCGFCHEFHELPSLE